MTEVASARDVIATADVEFLHGVPVHPGLAGADAILAALREAGYAVVPRIPDLAAAHAAVRALPIRYQMKVGSMLQQCSASSDDGILFYRAMIAYYDGEDALRAYLELDAAEQLQFTQEEPPMVFMRETM